MWPIVKSAQANTAEFEQSAFVTPAGFREYDARWRFPDQINLAGIQAVGAGIAALMKAAGKSPRIVVGHDYRSYSQSIKQALTLGLISGGAQVLDIGLCLSPTAYFAQFALDADGVAMVTASHNENGWTGVKIGMDRPVTFGPDEMSALKDLVLSGTAPTDQSGTWRAVENFGSRYLDDLVKAGPITGKLKAVVACGNGTAGLFAPDALRRLGVEVIERDCNLDYTFPRFNPNPEDIAMLHDLGSAVIESHADIGFAFDGDGDRCGVVDKNGREIFADKIGLLLARDWAASHPNASFIVDVKSTGLFASDPVLKAAGIKVDYWKTGHSHIKRRVRDLGALAGFEKSGHFFFGAPLGHGYDDGIASAIAICRMLDHAQGQSLDQLYDALPITYQSPTMAPFCPDEEKYAVVDRITAHFQHLFDTRAQLLGLAIARIDTVNGVRVTLADGTWGLVRASSNKPSLVVVVESPISDQSLHAMFGVINEALAHEPSVGAYDQRI
jgi:phosphomannomutase/phosphoglucomutase